MIQGMSGRKNVGRPWIIEGSVFKAGKRVRHIKKSVTISSEEELEKAEAELRKHLYEKASEKYGQDVQDLRIEVTSNIE